VADQFNMREDKPEDVQVLFKAATRRRENRKRYQLLSEMLEGKTVSVMNNPQLFEALNRENMEFEEILKLHPEQVKDALDLVKRDRDMARTGGRWWNPASKARWGAKGHVPYCCYIARPATYWQNKKLTNHFFNTFTKFRVSESRI